MKTLKILLSVVAFAFAANMNAQKTTTKKVTQKVTATSAEQTTTENSMTHIEGMGITKTVKMNGGTLHVQGSDNTITVSGFAHKVIAEGANITVRIDKVNSVKIDGVDTKVSYRTSANKNGKPTVSVNGVNSGVSRIK